MNSFDLIFIALTSPLIAVLLYGSFVFQFDPEGKTTNALVRLLK